MANFNPAYTTNTTEFTIGTETYKYSQSVSTINTGETIDTSVAMCSPNSPISCSIFPTYAASKELFDGLWTYTETKYSYESTKEEITPTFCFGFVNGDYSFLEQVGQNTVFNIGKQIYNNA